MSSKFIILLLTLFVASSIQQQTIPCDFELAVIPHPIASLCNFYVICVFKEGQIRACPPNEIFVPFNSTFGECVPGKRKKKII
jgi:hypothetical protein